MSIARTGEQGKLFDTPLSLPNGLVYRPELLTPEEEEVRTLPAGFVLEK